MDGDDFDLLFRKLIVKPWTKDKALWEVLVIPNVISKTTVSSSEPGVNVQYAAIFCRFHHSLCDIYSIVKLNDTVHSPKVIDEQRPYLSKMTATSKSKLQRIVDGIILPFKIFYDLSFGLLSLKMSDPFGAGQVSGDITYCASAFESLSEIKAVKTKYGVSFTAVLVAMITKGIRKNMIKRFGKVKRNISLHLPLPVSSHSDKLRNHASYGFITLPLIEEDPIKRLKTIHKEFELLRTSTLLKLQVIINIIMGSQFAWVVKLMIRFSFKQPVVCWINVPLAPIHISAFGYSVKDYYSTPGIGGSKAVLFGFFSYAGSGKLWMSSDSSIFNSKEEAEYCITECQNELKILKEYRLENVEPV